MKRRSGGQPITPRRRKAATPKRGNAPKVVRGRNPSIADLQEQLDRRTRERDEALARQAATADILRIISQSPAEVRPVFDSIVFTAVRLLHCDLAVLLLREGTTITHAAAASPDGPYADLPRPFPLDPGANFPSRAIVDKTMLHLPDWSLIDPPEFELKMQKMWSVKSSLYLPLLREGDCIGVLGLAGPRPNTFGAAEIAQAEAFRDQAVIVIENVRLFEAEQQRTAQLTESLEQQTATSEVLKVISSSPGDLQPVFATMLENAVRICDAKFGNIYGWDGGALHLMASHNTPAALAEARGRSPNRPGPETPTGRMIATKTFVHVADLATEHAYSARDPWIVSGVELARVRTLLVVPMLKENELVGAFTIYRQEVRPFTDKQIDLVKNFAAQAVIAIENTRLLNELRQRTNDLTELLEQQTATSDVLRVISSSPGDLEPVFGAMLENAVRISGAKFGNLFLREGDFFHVGATTRSAPPAYVDYLRRERLFRASDPRVGLGRLLRTKQTYQVADLTVASTHDDKLRVATIELAAARTLIGVPMLKEGEVIGAIAIYRQEVRPFTDKQIALVQNFAAQAVIAIENTRLLTELRQRTDDLTELLEQQTATSEVLQVISSSPGDLQPVFATMLGNAARICDAKFGNIFRWDGDAFSLVATHNTPPAFAEYRKRRPLPLKPNLPFSRMVVTNAVVHCADAAALPAYTEQRDPDIVAAVELAGIRTFVAVPMLKENKLIGALIVYRQEVHPFTDKQIELVKNFAAQAVIAIENARLLSELRQRTDDLTESLEQQTATSEVLSVISSSPGDLGPVFQAMLENAVRICDAKCGNVYRAEGDGLRIVATHNTPSVFAEARRSSAYFSPGPKNPVRRMMTTKAVVHVTDVAATDAYAEREPAAVASVELGGTRTLVIVPMLKDNELVGAFMLARQEVLPFTDKQIELVKNFAAQAVIAVENTRLLNKLRESLQQQTATANVLKVISRSTFDLQVVLDTLVESASRLCEADSATIHRPKDDAYGFVASYGFSIEFAQYLENHPIRPHRGSVLGRAVLDNKTIHVADVRADPDYSLVEQQNVGKYRTVLSVPLMREGVAVGVITLTRDTVRPFTETQIELVTTFADQAVIAIENARLLDELRQRTDELGRSVDELRALGEVSQAVNSTLDLETVLTTIVGRAVQLSRTDAGAIYVFDEDRHEFCLHATYGMSEMMIAAITDRHIGLGDANIGAAVTQRKPIQVPDIRNQPSPINEIILREGYRGILIVPLLRPDHIVGALVVRRKTPGEFPKSTIDLLQTFADQSVVAIQNARLFENADARTRELAKSLEDLRTAQDRLVQTEKLASLGQLTAGIAHEIKNPLNFVNNFSAVSVELIDELREALGGVHIDSKLRAEISEIAGTLQGNLDKVVQHGKRADAIVKNMLLHSRQGSGEHRPVDINALVEESLNLAYHGARAEKQGFNITLERSFDPAAGEVDLFPQEITRVLLNLISNGFYAATKRKAEADGGDYEPTLAAATKNLGDSVEIRIRDNGTGIPPEVKEKLFNPFFTTKPAGEGTGLGLSISHDIIVKQHGGAIEVDTQPGEFTEFRIVLPRVFLFKSGERM